MNGRSLTATEILSHLANCQDGTVGREESKMVNELRSGNVMLAEFTGGPELRHRNLGMALSNYHSVPYEPFRFNREFPSDLFLRLHKEDLEKEQWIPLDLSREHVVVMCVDPSRIKALHLGEAYFPKVGVKYFVTTPAEFHDTLEQAFAASHQVTHYVHDGGGSSIGNVTIPTPFTKTSTDERNVVQMVNRIIVDGHKQGASDIHFEPGLDGDPVLVRFRRDGILQRYTELPAQTRNAIVSRLKIMANLDISERRRPQDGKIALGCFTDLNTELRVATLPTSNGGEDVILRILGTSRPLGLDNLGLLPEIKERLERIIVSPYGLIIVCGPTGSGKTSSLHAILNRLNTPEVKILTAEDPVEITQRGLRQVQIAPKIRNFASILRAFLRCDPDIIMIGEMRDSETASIGIEAALTGHLVLATLHTNSAPEAMIRLLDLGVDPFSFSDTLLGVLSQRLVRRICPDCSEEVALSPEERDHFVMEYCADLLRTDWFLSSKVENMQKVRQDLVQRYGRGGRLYLRKPNGCDLCRHTGYVGRIPLHELMLVSEDTKTLIQEGARVKQLRTQALQDGMHSLRMDGMIKALLGLTDVTQVRSATVNA